MNNEVIKAMAATSNIIFNDSKFIITEKKIKVQIIIIWILICKTHKSLALLMNSFLKIMLCLFCALPDPQLPSLLRPQPLLENK
jgi:hypothetical protein